MRLIIQIPFLVLSLASMITGCATSHTAAAGGKELTVHEPKIAVCVYSGRIVTIQPNGTKSYM